MLYLLSLVGDNHDYEVSLHVAYYNSQLGDDYRFDVVDKTGPALLALSYGDRQYLGIIYYRIQKNIKKLCLD